MYRPIGDTEIIVNDISLRRRLPVAMTHSNSDGSQDASFTSSMAEQLS